MILEDPDDENTVEDFLIMLNSLASSTASGLVRDTLEERCDRPVAALLEGEHAPVRSRLLGALIIGHIMNKAMWGRLSDDPAVKPLIRQRIMDQVRLSLAPL